MSDFDVVVIGTGASGVSAAFPIAEAGLSVMMVDPDDGGSAPMLPDHDYLEARRSSPDQWRWMLGPAPRLETGDVDSSPKFRVPTLARVFENYATTMGIESNGFTSAGSLTSGGLTAAWGAGVASFSDADLEDFPISARDLVPYYRALAERMGLSGAAADDLSSHFGLDGLTDEPTAQDQLASHIAERYNVHRAPLRAMGFALGRPRLAVLSSDRSDRLACNERGLCLWGCPRHAIYGAGYDLSELKKRFNVRHASGTLIEELAFREGLWEARGRLRATGQPFKVAARVVILAAGVLSTTKLAMKLAHCREKPVRLLSTPTAAFALFFPKLFGRAHERGTALAQNWYTLVEDKDEVCGGLFPTRGLPVAEFVGRVPVTTPVAIDLMRSILPATTVGNIFFHSRFSAHSITLREDDRLVLRGGFDAQLRPHLNRSAKRLRTAFRRLGGFALPGSFALGAAGSDVHYAGTLPMRHEPAPLETDANGALSGQAGVYVADASVLTSLPAKSHTFTVMANAARIGASVALSLRHAPPTHEHRTEL